MDEQLVLVDQVQPVELGRELAASEQDPAGVASLSFCTPSRRSPAMWWLLVHGKSLRVDDTTYLGLASSLTAHSHGRRRLLVAAGDGRPVALREDAGTQTPAQSGPPRALRTSARRSEELRRSE